jgi:putative peptidoglycan lipid II flippase
MPSDAPLPSPTPTPPAGPDLGGALAGAIRVVFGFTLLSRFAGLAREVLTARVLGDTIYGSAFAAAFIVPNLFRRLFGEGALSAAFLPEYTRLSKSDPDLAARLASVVVAALTLVTGTLTLILMGILLGCLWGGVGGPDSALSIKLTMVMLPMMPMVCITAILGGMLQSHGRFAAPAAAPILLNVFMIAGALTHFFLPASTVDLAREQAAYWIAIGAVVASVAQIVWSLAALRPVVRWTRVVSGVSESSRTVLRRFGPVAIGLGALQLSTLADQVIAMWPIWVGPTMFGHPVPLDESSNAILSNTSRFYQFPLGVFGLAVATAVFPLLSRTADNPAQFADMLRRGIRVSLLIGLPASIGLWAVAPDLTAVMLEGGSLAFSAEGVDRAAAVLVGFAPAVWAFSLNNVLTRAFYARGDTRTPMTISLISVAVSLGLNFALIWPLREAGLAWATAISGGVQFLLLVFALKRRGLWVFDAPTFRGCLRIAMAAAGMTIALVALRMVMPSPTTWSEHAGRLAALVAAGAGSFGVLALLARLPELRWLAAKAPPGGVGAAFME